MSIYDIVPYGFDNGIRKKDIKQLMNLKERDFYSVINSTRMRASAEAVVSRGNRYFRSNNPEDYDYCISRLVKTGIGYLRTAKALALKRPDTSGQISWKDYLDKNLEELKYGEEE